MDCSRVEPLPLHHKAKTIKNEKNVYSLFCQSFKRMSSSRCVEEILFLLLLRMWPETENLRSILADEIPGAR